MLTGDNSGGDRAGRDGPGPRVGPLRGGAAVWRARGGVFDRLRPAHLGLRSADQPTTASARCRWAATCAWRATIPPRSARGDPDEFLSKPRWQRVLIALAGPTTNFLMAVLLTAGSSCTAASSPAMPISRSVIAGVMKDSPAQKAGMQAGDRIVSFAGVKNPTWDRINLELALPRRDARAGGGRPQRAT